MTGWLKENTAASVVVGPFVAETDGYTSKESHTALSGIIYKDAGASATVNPAASHTASGWYHIDLAAGCSDTVGLMKLSFANSSCHLPVWDDFMVVTASAYDSIVAGTDLIGAEVADAGITAAKFAADSIGPAAIAASTIVASTFGADAIDAAAIATDAIDADAVADATIDAATFAADAINAAAIAASAIVASTFGTGAIEAATFAADAINAAAIGASAIVASTFGASAIDSVALAANAANKVADHTMRREWGEAASSADGDTKAGRSLLGATAKLVNKIADSSGSLIVYEADDSTQLFTQDITADGSASPITALDTN